MKNESKTGKAWIVASGKGGVGKSLLTSSLAAGLCQMGKTAVVVDADTGLRDQDVLMGLQDRIVFDLMDVMNKDCTLEQALVSHPDLPGLRLLPASQFARVKDVDPRAFRKLVQKLKSMADHVLIDCPAGVERGLRGALGGADETLLICTPDDVCMRDAEKTASLLMEKNAPRPLLIVNRLDAELIEAGEMYTARVVADTLDLRLFGEVPYDRAIYRAVVNHLLPVQVDCAAREAILRIARRMDGQEVPEAAIGTVKRSGLQRLFHRKMKGLKRL